MLLSDGELKEIGFKMGHRKIIIAWIGLNRSPTPLPSATGGSVLTPSSNMTASSSNDPVHVAALTPSTPVTACRIFEVSVHFSSTVSRKFNFSLKVMLRFYVDY